MELRGRDIRAARSRGQPPVTQDELAEALGVYGPYISAVECEKLVLSQEEIARWIGVVEKLIAKRERNAVGRKR